MTKEELVKELEEWVEDKQENGYTASAVEIANILAKHKDSPTPEPLAVLADRKGYGVVYQNYAAYRQVRLFAQLSFHGGDVLYTGKTYPEAELKARQYLESLPDREGW